jgi:hypothetical protein
LATLSYKGSAGSAVIGLDVWDQAGVEATRSFDVTVTAAPAVSGPNPVVNMPSTEKVAVGGKVAIGGVSIADAWAAGNPGSMAVTVTSTDGTIAMTSGGTAVSGSGTNTIFVSGSLAQINADLSTLTYTGGNASGTGSVDLDVWDQAGVEANTSFAVQVEPAATIASAAATVGAETIQASVGLNTIATGTSGDTIRFVGSGNAIDTESGANMIYDSGTNNGIVPTAAGHGDVDGNTLTNGGVFDPGALPAGTFWNGTAPTLPNILGVGMNGMNAQPIAMSADLAAAAIHAGAMFGASGPMGPPLLLAHAIA